MAFSAEHDPDDTTGRGFLRGSERAGVLRRAMPSATIGSFHELSVVGLVDGGVLLDGGERELFLPDHLTPEGSDVGASIEVFVYTDKEGEPQATTHRPAAVVGEAAYLECVATTRAGAFFAWGLPKDLYVPPQEQEHRVQEGRWYVVVVCVDAKGERLIGSTRVARHLDYDVDHLELDQEVELLVYGQIDAGVQVVVDRRHRGLVHGSTVRQPLPVGSTHVGYVREVREDNRIDVELTRRGRAGDQDAEALILSALVEAGGHLPLHDRSRPAEIVARLGISKKAFKRACGGLYKKRRITLGPDGIALME